MSAPTLGAILAASAIEPAVRELRPDYTVVLIAAAGLPGGPSDDASDAWLREAERAAVARLGVGLLEDRPQVARGARPTGVATARRVLPQ